MSLLLLLTGAGSGGGAPAPAPLAVYSRRMRRRVEEAAAELRPVTYSMPTPDQEEDFILWLLDLEDEPPPFIS